MIDIEKQLRKMYEENKERIMENIVGLYDGVKIDIEFYPEDNNVIISDWISNNTYSQEYPEFYLVYKGSGSEYDDLDYESASEELDELFERNLNR